MVTEAKIHSFPWSLERCHSKVSSALSFRNKTWNENRSGSVGRLLELWQSSFSQLHKIGNVGIIANFVFPYVCSFLLYLHQLILINWKLEIKEHMRITFHSCMLYWTSWFLMAELKQSWQCCHSCIREHMWKTLLLDDFLKMISSAAISNRNCVW